MSWRPPAMTADGAPQLCPECRDGKHGNCDGDAWSDALNDIADCPCGDPAHSCPCVIVFAGTENARRLVHHDCPKPEHRRQDTA